MNMKSVDVTCPKLSAGVTFFKCVDVTPFNVRPLHVFKAAIFLNATIIYYANYRIMIRKEWPS